MLYYELQETHYQVGSFDFVIETFKDLDDHIDQMFTVLEKLGANDLVDEYCPYFGILWPSGKALAQELVHHDLAGQRVLEIGCGLALPGMVCAKLGAEVTVSDSHPDVPDFLSRNLARNKIKGCQFRHLDWKDAARSPLPYDMIIGSDVLYEKAHISLITAVLAQLPEQGRAIIVDPGRPHLPDFLTVLDQQGYQVQTKKVVDPEEEETLTIIDIKSARVSSLST